ncbi:MAG TPA: hypothetical protein VFV68_04065 [Agriterribacter sp.]|nr:hypothetical protein [Agriterribacter sp.]
MNSFYHMQHTPYTPATGKYYALSLYYFFFILLLFFVQSTSAQNTSAKDLLESQKSNAIGLYYQSLQTQSGLYNGSEYVSYAHLLKEGHPYFDTAVLTPGWVYYDNLLYQDVPMLYDIISDELIARHFNNVFLIQLIRSKVDSFGVLNHQFLHLGTDSTKNENIREGFYDRLYNGKIKLFVKRSKNIQESIVDLQVERKVYQKDKYFVYKEGTYYEVYTQKSILQLFPDKKVELRQMLRKQKIKFKKNREYAMKLMVQQYDALNH